MYDRGISMTHANYDRAVELLKERFGQRHRITHATMQQLLQLSVQRDNVQSVGNFYDKMETHARILESLGQHQDTYEDCWFTVILVKIPADIRRNLGREHGDMNWLLCDL